MRLKSKGIILGLLISSITLGRLLYWEYTKVDFSKIQSLGGLKAQAIGHGGMGNLSLFPFQAVPWNSEKALREALKLPLDGIELDIQITADSVLVLYHNALLEEESDAQGSIIEKNWEDLAKVNYQLGFPYDLFHNEKIMRFDEALNIMLEQEKFPLLYLDFHADNFQHGKEAFFMVPMFCRALERLLVEKNIPLDRVYLITMFPELMEDFLRMKKRPILVYEEVTDLNNALKHADHFGISHIQAKYSLLNMELVKKAHDKGIFIATHGGKSRLGLAKRLSIGVDAIHADNPKALLDLLAD